MATTTFRRLDGTPSEYYVREFEVISGNEYETFETAFSRSIYPDTLTNSLGVANRVYSFQFNKDIDITNLVSNRCGNLTEMYLGFIKRSGENTFNWSDVYSDWESNFEDSMNSDRKETISQNVSGGVGTIEKNTGDR